MNTEELHYVLNSLRALPAETEWVEFKHNDAEPEEIGEYLSAISNSTRLLNREAGYIVWGIENQTHRIVGTSFRPRQRKIGNEELENWLARLLHPRIDFKIHETILEGEPVVLFEVQPCQYTPIRFRETEWIRSGSYKKKLKDFPEKERALWLHLSSISFEKSVAKPDVTGDEVIALIDYPGFFELTKRNLPPNKNGIIDRLLTERVIKQRAENRFDITNLGALLFAKRLTDFESLARKATRVIIYRGANRTETIKEQVGARGYAIGFEGLLTTSTISCRETNS